MITLFELMGGNIFSETIAVIDEAGTVYYECKQVKGYAPHVFIQPLQTRNLLDVRRANIQGSASGGAHSGSMGSAPVSPGRNVFVRVMVDLGW